jgi:hypothetical protein
VVKAVRDVFRKQPADFGEVLDRTAVAR